jgi:PAS domain-containing protein/GGDEF domain-containing protein
MEVTWVLVLAVLASAAIPSVLALVWRQRWMDVRARAEAEREHHRQLRDALDIGLLVVDADDRVSSWNIDYERLYPAIASGIEVGQPFASVVRRTVELGLVAEAAGREEAWIAERLAQHRQPRAPMLRRMPDGRWRRITERYLANGSMVSYSVDVDDLVHKEQALAEAERTARQAADHLRDAIEAMPAGFELFDAEDRLVLCNARTRAQFPRIAHLIDGGITFEGLVRANAAVGGLPDLTVPVDALISTRLKQRATADGTARRVDLGHRQFDMYERRTSDGGVVTVRVDITDELAQRAALDRERERLQDAIEALPDAFALFDADDRLVRFNQRYRALYRESAPSIQPGARFEDILRYGLAHGQYPQAAGREEDWVAERLHSHREPGPPLLQELPGNRWLRIDERRTRDGGVAGVRTDVTALIRREQALERLNHELDEANARLADLIERDPATGVGNATALNHRLAEEFARARRHGSPLTVVRVVVGDVDGAPHALRMREAAVRLAGCVRRPGDLLARTDTDDFVLLLPHTGAAAFDMLYRRCRDACSDLPGSGSVQIGSAATDGLPDAATPRDLLEAARATLKAVDLPVAPR